MLHKLFPPNAWMKLTDFNVLTSCTKDELHQWFLGLYEEHIIPAMVRCCELGVRSRYPSLRAMMNRADLPGPTLYVGRADDVLGRVPLISCFLDGNATSTIPHKYSSRQKDAFGCCCADGAGPTSRRGSHVYEINAWLWNFGRP